LPEQSGLTSCSTNIAHTPHVFIVRIFRYKDYQPKES